MTVLAGVRVLDLSVWRPGPYATQLLAEMGADVIKVEPPGGDPMRVFPDLFAMLNWQKKTVELDLKSQEGRARARELAAESDMAIEGWRPGVAARLGVGYDDLRAVNPAIVYCSISGFGATGPLTTAPGHDINYQAYAGMVPPPDDRPPSPAPPFADVAGGMAAAFAMCAAYAGRLRTGAGAFVDVSLADVLAGWVRPMGAVEMAGGHGKMKGAAAYGTFATADGAIALGIVSEDHFWDSLCGALGLDDLVGLGIFERNDRVEELRAAVTAGIAKQGRDDLVARLQAADVPVSPILSPDEMAVHPHFADSERPNGVRIVPNAGG
jgi:crotonobetainyl-CoA:carnitine CoA-transferase CaiB-like acyl-CoA transferase